MLLTRDNLREDQASVFKRGLSVGCKAWAKPTNVEAGVRSGAMVNGIIPPKERQPKWSPAARPENFAVIDIGVFAVFEKATVEMAKFPREPRNALCLPKCLPFGLQIVPEITTASEVKRQLFRGSHFDRSNLALRRLRWRAGFDFGLGRYRRTTSAMASRILGGIAEPSLRQVEKSLCTLHRRWRDQWFYIAQQPCPSAWRIVAEVINGDVGKTLLVKTVCETARHPSCLTKLERGDQPYSTDDAADRHDCISKVAHEFVRAIIAAPRCLKPFRKAAVIVHLAVHDIGRHLCGVLIDLLGGMDRDCLPNQIARRGACACILAGMPCDQTYRAVLVCVWQARMDLNRRPADSKSAALPLSYAPSV